MKTEILKNPLVSIIVPVYNIEKYLAECLDSILLQDYKNIELILVNDGSTDSSLQICNKYQQNDSRIKILNQKNQGVSFATYNGLNLATGDFVCFADHDDILLPGFISKMLDLFEDDVDLVCCNRADLYDNEIKNFINSISKKQEKKYYANYKKFFGGGYTEYRVKKLSNCQLNNLPNCQPEIQTKLTGDELLLDTVTYSVCNLSLVLWGRIYRSSFLKKFNFAEFSEKLPTLFLVDIFAMPQILHNAKFVKHSNQILYIHREVNTSISRSGKLNNFYFEMIDSYKFILDMYKQWNLKSIFNYTFVLYAKTCLMRLWYKLRNDKIDYFNKVELLEKINSRFKLIYPELKLLPMSLVDKINFKLFSFNKVIWEKTIGFMYFYLLKRIKK